MVFNQGWISDLIENRNESLAESSFSFNLGREIQKLNQQGIIVGIGKPYRESDISQDIHDLLKDFITKKGLEEKESSETIVALAKSSATDKILKDKGSILIEEKSNPLSSIVEEIFFPTIIQANLEPIALDKLLSLTKKEIFIFYAQNKSLLNQKEKSELVRLPDSYLLANNTSDQALEFGGREDYLTIANSDDINFGNQDNFTIEVWVKAAREQLDLRFGDNDIIEKWADSKHRGYPFVIRYDSQSGRIYVHRYDGINHPTIYSKRSINDNYFHHIAFVKDGKKLYLYIDGELEDTTVDTTHNSKKPTKNNSSLYIACRGRSDIEQIDRKKNPNFPITRNHFRGQIDEIRIWNIACSLEKIKDRMKDEFKPAESLSKAEQKHLVGYWDFKIKNSSLVPNWNQNGEPAKIEGAPRWVNGSRRNYWSLVQKQKLESCTAHSCASLFEYFVRRTTGKTINVSRSFLYRLARDLSSSQLTEGDRKSTEVEKLKTEGGVSIRSTMTAMVQLGILEEEYCPKEEHFIDLSKLDSFPFRGFCYAFAQQNKATSYFRIDRLQVRKVDLLDQIKVFLCSGFPIVFGFPTTQELKEISGELKCISGKKTHKTHKGCIPFDFIGNDLNPERAGHSVVAVGYDDTIQISNPIPLDPNEIKTSEFKKRYLAVNEVDGKQIIQIQEEFYDDNFTGKDDFLQDLIDLKQFIEIKADKTITTTGAFRIRNSWGSDWGEDGYGWLPYAYLLTGQAIDWWTMFDANWIEKGLLGAIFGGSIIPPG